MGTIFKLFKNKIGRPCITCDSTGNAAELAGDSESDEIACRGHSRWPERIIYNGPRSRRLDMRRLNGVLFLVLMCAITAAAGNKDSGTTTLKNLEPAGTPGTQGKKNKKTKQQFDFSFEASGKIYTCRTSEKTTVSATDFVVGSNVNYEIDGDNGKLKSAAGKQVKCTIVRVENISSSPQ
jgi:hypothetical protein